MARELRMRVSRALCQPASLPACLPCWLPHSTVESQHVSGPLFTAKSPRVWSSQTQFSNFICTEHLHSVERLVLVQRLTVATVFSGLLLSTLLLPPAWPHFNCQLFGLHFVCCSRTSFQLPRPYPSHHSLSFSSLRCLFFPFPYSWRAVSPAFLPLSLSRALPRCSSCNAFLFLCHFGLALYNLLNAARWRSCALSLSRYGPVDPIAVPRFRQTSPVYFIFHLLPFHFLLLLL